ncbi:MAG: helix-turn-helix domain-containing protein [Paraclostridium sp.]
MTNEQILDEIKRRGLKLGYVANLLGVSYMTLYRKLHGKSSWKYEEMEKLKKLFNIS